MLSSPGDLEDLRDLMTALSSTPEKGLQLMGRVSDTLLLKNGDERSGAGGSVPSSDLKCWCQVFSRSSLVSPGTLEKGTVLEAVTSRMMCQELPCRYSGLVLSS